MRQKIAMLVAFVLVAFVAGWMTSAQTDPAPESGAPQTNVIEGPDLNPVVESTPAHPGSQTHYDTNSFFSCGATRPDSSFTVQYSWPITLDQYHVRYQCIEHSHIQGVVCEGIAIKWAGGSITGQYELDCAPF